MTGETYPITADLGTGSFAVARLTASTETFITEKPLLEGGYSRAVQGGRRVLVLEGRYSVTRDGAFFSTLLSTVKTTHFNIFQTTKNTHISTSILHRKPHKSIERAKKEQPARGTNCSCLAAGAGFEL